MGKIIKEEIQMLQIGDTIVHLDVLNRCFVCDIKKCKGICCIEGQSGAPLEKKEAKNIKNNLPKFFHKLTPDAQKTIKEKGISLVDFEKELTTTTINVTGPCVFVQFDKDGRAYCVIEKSYEEGIIKIRKPISCHLYPVRVKKFEKFIAVNYHEWDICKDAVISGEKNKMPVYIFLKDALIRKFGKNWYDELCIAAQTLNNEKTS